MSAKQFIIYVATLMLVFLASMGFGYHINATVNLSPVKYFCLITVVGSLVATTGIAIGATILSK